MFSQTNIPQFAKSERLKYFPKTLFTKNSTTFDIISKNYPYDIVDTNGTGETHNFRLALEVILIHGKKVITLNDSIVLKKTTDDEYTPSIFSTYTYMTGANETGSRDSAGYFQWKPISYQTSSRKSTASQQVSVLTTGSSSECQLSVLPLGLATALYGSTPPGNVTRWFTVFGTPGDKGSLNSTYNTW